MEELERYYIVPLVEEYRRLDPQSERAQEISRKIAVNVGDYVSLRLILGIDPPEFARFYPDMENRTPSTLSTIDSFLDKYGGDSALSGLPEGILEEPEEIENNIGESAGIDGNPEETEYESFSKLVREGRYESALRLIKAQNLNNPQKSIYFAHQMRFLKKLIALEHYKTRRQGPKTGL